MQGSSVCIVTEYYEGGDMYVIQPPSPLYFLDKAVKKNAILRGGERAFVLEHHQTVCDINNTNFH